MWHAALLPIFKRALESQLSPGWNYSSNRVVW